MKIAILGAGATGLTTALRLAQKTSSEIPVFEKDSFLGGHASTFQVNSTPIEKGYHHWFTSDNKIIELMSELGLQNHIGWYESSVGTVFNSKIYDFMTPIDLLRYKPLSIINRVSLGLSSLKISKIKNWHDLENFTAVDWLNENVNPQIYHAFWEPMLIGKFGEEHYKEVGMPWLWGKMNTRFKSREGFLSKEKLGYPIGSFDILFNSLSQKCEKLGVKIHLNSQVNQIKSNHGSLDVSISDAETLNFDSVIATVPSNVFHRITTGLEQSYIEKLQNTRYMSAVQIILELKHPLSKYYWLNIADRSFPFVGVIEHTNLVNESIYGNSHIVYLSNYLTPKNSQYHLNKTELLEKYLPFLNQINNKFSENWIIKSHYQKIPGAQPIIESQYSNKMPAHETGIKNLYLGNTSQIYPEDRGTNYSVELGEKLAELLIKKSINN